MRFKTKEPVPLCVIKGWAPSPPPRPPPACGVGRGPQLPHTSASPPARGGCSRPLAALMGRHVLEASRSRSRFPRRTLARRLPTTRASSHDGGSGHAVRRRWSSRGGTPRDSFPLGSRPRVQPRWASTWLCSQPRTPASQRKGDPCPFPAPAPFRLPSTLLFHAAIVFVFF